MAKKRKTIQQVELALSRERSKVRQAQNRLKAYKEGIQEGLNLAKEARRDN